MSLRPTRRECFTFDVSVHDAFPFQFQEDLYELSEDHLSVRLWNFPVPSVVVPHEAAEVTLWVEGIDEADALFVTEHILQIHASGYTVDLRIKIEFLRKGTVNTFLRNLRGLHVLDTR